MPDPGTDKARPNGAGVLIAASLLAAVLGLAPWLAGNLYGLSDSYTLALLVAGGLGLISAISALALSRRQSA